MTALINTLTASPLSDTGPGELLSAIAILVLLAMLLTQEFVRIRGASRAQRLIQVLDAAVYPLIVVFSMVILLRLGLIIVQHVHPGPG
jgi:hypothetical protein